ncbi:MAG: Cerebroside-sulfatase, partial [Verrucomicrobia bacterium]
RYPVHLGHPAWGTFPREAEAGTLARRLQRAGYATAIAGKWQLTLLGREPDHPHRLGFDTYCLFGWHEGPRYHQPWIWQDGRRREDVADRYGPDVYVEFLIDFMKRHREGPFFAFYSMALCHAVSDDFQPAPPYGPKGRYENFAEMMAAMDERVGRLVEAVDRLGLAERTLIFFLTDNGSPRSVYVRHENGRFQSEKVVSRWRGQLIPGGKGTVTDWGIRVPGIARWPGRIASGSRSGALIDLSDLLPTFCELAGVPVAAAEGLDGRSFAGLLQGGQDPGREWVFSQSKPNLWCLRTREWKLRSDGTLWRIPGEADTETRVEPAEAGPEAVQVRAKLEAIRARLFGP